MATPRASADYYRRQQRILALLLLAIRQTWKRMSPSARWSEQYEEDGIGAQLTMLVGAAQVAAVRDADEYVASVLAELGIVLDAASGILAPSAFAGVAGDGRPLDSLLSLGVRFAGQRFNTLRSVSPAAEPIERPEWTSDALWESLERERIERYQEDMARNIDEAARVALAEAGRWIEQTAATAVIDAARAGEAAASATHREVTGYTRMLNLPSCSRCVVLAGKFYRWNEGFERHPLCDCRHIPSSEAVAGDLTIDPAAYFEALPTADALRRQYPDLTVQMRRDAGLVSQEDVFTVAGAEAIRLGADINQVVNARRGMQRAQVYGRDVLMTREGITRFGVFGRSRGDFEKQRGRRYQASRHVRLMPETILRDATDRDDAIRLLKLHGFIL